MRRHALAPAAATLIIAACGGATPRSELWNRAAPLARPVCSHDRVAAIAARIAREWPGRGEFELRCAGGRFPERGFFVEARWSTVRRVGIVGGDRDGDIVPFVELVANRSVRPIVRQPFVMDLDGNGIDEVGDAWRDELPGTSGDQLIVWTTDGAKLQRIEGPYLSAYRAGLGSCYAWIELRAQSIAVSVRSSDGLSPTECLPAGQHQFVMRDGQLVRLLRPGARATPRPAQRTYSFILDRVRS